MDYSFLILHEDKGTVIFKKDTLLKMFNFK